MKLSLGLLFSLIILSVSAQDSLNEALKQQMVMDWQRAKVYTREYLDAMPADKYGFRPVDSVRSFAEQMLHLAQANVGMAFFGTGFLNPGVQKMFFRGNFEKSPAANNKDSVVYYVNTSYDFVINAIQLFDFGKLGEVVSRDMPGGKRTATRLGWLMKLFEHQTHHRGQCTVYIRLVGIRPPGELLWDK